MLLRSVEEYVRDREVTNIFLVTRGQEEFYSKNGYIICDPNEQINRYTDIIENEQCKSLEEAREIILAGPPPPPMPSNLFKQSSQIIIMPDRTFMKKNLWP